MKEGIKVASVVLSGLLLLSSLPELAYGQTGVTTDPPVTVQPASTEPCPKGKRGGAIGGIVVASAFWIVLPMSIPVLITQSKKLKAHNKARYEHRCQYAHGF